MLPHIRKILYATDFGENSVYALAHAAELARLSGAKLHLLHVVPELSADAKFTIQTYILSSVSRQDMLHERVQHAEAHLAEVLESFWSQQSGEILKVRDQVSAVDVIESYPAETILKVAKKSECDLIVMGAHEKGVVHTFLGNVAKSVLRRSRVPVMIVPLPEREDDD